MRWVEPRLWLLVAIATACTQIISQEIREVRCVEIGKVGPPACNSGEYCASDRCSVCLPREVCGDQLDNDCNGQVDDACEAPSEAGKSLGEGGFNSMDTANLGAQVAAGGEGGSASSGRRPFFED